MVKIQKFQQNDALTVSLKLIISRLANLLCFVIVFAFVSCDRLSDEFISALLNTENLSADFICYEHPSEQITIGPFYEVYYLGEDKIPTITNNIDGKQVELEKTYKKYNSLFWEHCANGNEEPFSFLATELQRGCKCFDQSKLFDLLTNEKNYYTFVIDRFGDKGLFILDVENALLYYVSTNMA